MLMTVLFAAIGWCTAPSPDAAAADGNVYVVGNFPVEARAQDAVKAKERAIQDGQQAAFRSLLKRIVPVTAYNRLKKLRQMPAANLIEGFSVRSERNSSTEYIASYDFSFQASAVQRLLDAEGVPYVDKQAPKITVVPVYTAGAQQPGAQAEAADAWSYAWRGLDLANTVTPVTLRELKREIHKDTLKAVASGDGAAQRILAGEYQTSLVVLAILEPEAGAKKVKVTLAGQDAIGPITLARTYRLETTDLAYTAELAAVVALGVIEGRWKAANAPRVVSTGGGPAPVAEDARSPWAPVGTPVPGAGGGLINIAVEFAGMGEWQQISRQLSQTPGVSDLDVAGLSARGARISLRYAGAPEDLARTLAGQGLALRRSGTGWALSGR